MIEENRPPKAKLLTMPEQSQEPCAKMPAWLPREAKRYWRQTAPELERRGVLVSLYQGLFTALCCLWGNYVSMGEQIRRDGMVLTGRGGRQYAHPLLAAQARAFALFLKVSREFGMTPASRRRVSTQ